MNRRKHVSLIIFFVAILASSCTPIGQNIIENTTEITSPNLSSTPAPDPIEELLSYLPVEWIDQHPAELTGPMVYYLDFEIIAKDLDLPDVSGTDDRQAKLPLITGISTQGLPFTPEAIDPLSATSFSDWGWDIADVSQALFLPDREVSIILGTFSIETVIDALTERGYTSGQSDQFAVLLDSASTQCFAVSQNMILIAPSSGELEEIIQQKSGTSTIAGDLPHFRQLISLADSMHGFILISSGDLVALGERLGFFAVPLANSTDLRPYTYDWDFAIIAFHYAEGGTIMDIGYAFPTDQEAEVNLPIIHESLTITPSFRNPSLTWADLITLKSITNDENLVVAQATTAGETFLGTTFRAKDYYGFLSARPVE